jgi:hypothetical protein
VAVRQAINRQKVASTPYRVSKAEHLAVLFVRIARCVLDFNQFNADFI